MITYEIPVDAVKAVMVSKRVVVSDILICCKPLSKGGVARVSDYFKTSVPEYAAVFMGLIISDSRLQGTKGDDKI